MNRKLAELARLYGVETSYTDMGRRRRDAAEESVLLALRALGAEVDRSRGIERALQARREELHDRIVEPVLPAWDGDLPAAALALPRGARAEITLEHGAPSGWPAARLPAGYHTLTVRTKNRAVESMVISAPRQAYRAFDRPAWGIFAPLYALHSKRSFGAGDVTDLEAFAEWTRALGGQVVATLPMLAAFMEEPFEPSPYSPVSRLFWNEFYADPARAPEFRTSRKAHRLYSEAPKPGRFVDYAATMQAKRRVLEALAQSFFASGNAARRQKFEAFVRSNPEVEAYARFRAVTERRRCGWRDWPQRLRDGRIEDADYDDSAHRYHLYAQWLIQEQIANLAGNAHRNGGLLYLDLPLGIHADGYDTWRHPAVFVQDMEGGAPPDLVFTAGQNWGFPPLHPEAIRADRHRYTIAFLRNHLEHAGLLRIDHVMGLHRLYWIPKGLPGSQGVYVRYPAEELYAILSLESHRNAAGIVGENLGTVPPEVNRSMIDHGISRMYVLQYEIVDDSNKRALPEPGAGSVASLNTHDMPPFAGFIAGTDIADRLDLGLLNAKNARLEEKQRARLRTALTRFLTKRAAGSGKGGPKGEQTPLLREALVFLGESEADLVLVNIEDGWQETLPQNVPATGDLRPNWRRRFARSIESIQRNRQIRSILRGLNDARNS